MCDKGRSCVLNDMRDRLVPAAAEWLRAALPDKDVPREEAAQAYQEITRWLMSNRSWIFSERSWCLIHKQLCPVHPSRFMESTQPLRKRRRLAPRPTVVSSQSEQQEQTVSNLATPTRIRKPLYLHDSGMTCVGWSSVGHQLHFADSSEAINAIYVAERRRNAEDASSSARCQ